MLTYSAKETIELGEKLGKTLSKGDVVALYGDLGSGKTTFTKGIGKGLGLKDTRQVNSPSFVLVKEYNAKITIYHLDLYRLENPREIEDIGIEEYLYGDGVAVVEWAEKIKNSLPKRQIAVRFVTTGEDKREIKIEDFRH